MMRKYFIFIGLCLTLFMGCGSDDGPSDNEPVVDDITITLSKSALELSEKAETVTVDVTTTGERWAATTTSDWVTLKTVGTSSSSGQITISVGANSGDARSASVIVSSATQSAKIAIEQMAKFKVSRSEVMTKSGGDEVAVTLSGRKEWAATADADWITATKVNNGTLNIAVSPTDKEQTRTGKVVVTSGSDELSITVNQESVEKTAIQVPAGYQLVWHDEFNEGTELNPEHWTHEVQGKGWVNNELQIYVDGEHNGKRVTELSDGKLRIHCFKSAGEVYSGRVYAHVDEGWQYAYIEARLMLPKGKGTWPAFWMMPVTVDWAKEGWPKCGEIDIMEEVGCVPNEVSSSLHAEGHNHTNGTQVTSATKIDKAEGEFHTYAIEWTEKNITTYVDGNVLLSYDNDGGGVKNWPYDKPYYIIFNLAWGGSWGGMNGVDETALPISYVIDYVRVFQK